MCQNFADNRQEKMCHENEISVGAITCVGFFLSLDIYFSFSRCLFWIISHFHLHSKVNVLPKQMTLKRKVPERQIKCVSPLFHTILSLCLPMWLGAVCACV